MTLLNRVRPKDVKVMCLGGESIDANCEWITYRPVQPELTGTMVLPGAVVHVGLNSISISSEIRHKGTHQKKLGSNGSVKIGGGSPL